MRFDRLALAHFLVIAALTGCAEWHGRTPGGSDAGRLPLDAGAIADGGPSPIDAGSRLDGGAMPRCAPADARRAICVESLCDAEPTWHLNGERCFPIECGTCEGTDCGEGLPSEAECEAAHAHCDAARCASTGGEWLWWAEECGHFECGVPPPAACEVGMPVCDCGPEQRFEPGVGCVVTGCPEVDPLPPETLCASTGGEWGPFCCNSVCGQRCMLPCAAMACHCPGVTQVFDSIRGCVDATECFERELGQACHPRARCAEGTICCDRCGGPGCAGMPTCAVPTCDDDPATDTCGNNSLAP